MFALYLFSFVYSLLKYTFISQASKLIHQWYLWNFFLLKIPLEAHNEEIPKDKFILQTGTVGDSSS